jgi:hypothetical protein
MKKTLILAAGAVMFAGVLMAAQDTTLERVEVRDPVRLEAYLEANASDAETRIAALEGSLGTNPVLAVTVGALTTTGAVTIAEGALADSTVVSADIKDGTIVNADINASAAIAISKLATSGNLALATLTNALDTAGGVLLTNTCVAADGKTNTYIFGPVGGVYVLRSIATSP